MNAEYYGWLGAKGYDTVIKIEDYDAYVYRTVGTEIQLKTTTF